MQSHSAEQAPLWKRLLSQTLFASMEANIPIWFATRFAAQYPGAPSRLSSSHLSTGS